MKFKVGRIVVYVGHPIRCASFYRDHFGFKSTHEWSEEWAEIDGGGCKIAFHQAYDDSGRPIKTPTGSAENPHKISFLVDDVGEARQKLVAVGIKVSEVKSFDGWEMCNAYDCEGHAFQMTNK